MIFGNIEQIHQLNEKFLRELHDAAERDGQFWFNFYVT